MRRDYIFLIFGGILAGVIFLSVLFFSSPTSTPQNSPLPTSAQPSRYPIVSIRPEYFPPKQADLPYIPQERGGGIDVRSTAVRASTAEIRKLLPELPYQQTKTLTTGQEVEILIPAQNLQYNAWTLSVQIFNLDYQIPETDPDYNLVKASFIEAANLVFDWMVSQGADPDKMIIVWGDRAFIQERAELWLSQ